MSDLLKTLGARATALTDKAARLAREGRMDDLTQEERDQLRYMQVEKERQRGVNNEFERHPLVAVTDETAEAIADLYRGDYHAFPWGSLARVIGGMPGGEVCTICAFSSQGKTTFTTSYVDEIFETTDEKTYYMTLEVKPKIARTHWACKRLGIDAGLLLSGDFLKLENWKDIRERVEREIRSQNLGDKFDRVRFSPVRSLSAENLHKAAKHAAEFGADNFIIDHMDHGAYDYKKSVEITTAILDIAQEYGFLVMPTTQLNNDVVRNNPIALHLPPQPQHVKFGGHKREMSTWQIGLYKPMRLSGVSPDEIAAFNRGMLKDPKTILEPETMAVSVMKHRIYGSREWSKVFLKVKYGKVFDRVQPYYGEDVA